MKRTASLFNGQALGISQVPVLDAGAFRDVVIRAVADGQRISALFGWQRPERGARVFAVLADDASASLHILACEVNGSYPSLTPECPQAHLFERELFEQCGVRPEGHPWLKPVRQPTAPEEFFRMEGEEVHEVSVGPVHAGIIEPGHFRFQCHGEGVHHLEIALGYQHRGVERALVGGPGKRTPHYIETLAGDTTIGHATAHAQAVEALGGFFAPARAHTLRGIALELERLANHAGDLGALANDIGFLPTASYCGRLRGDFLNLTALLCGSRFGRGLVRPGGVAFDVDAERVRQMKFSLADAVRDATSAVSLLWKTPSVMARFEETGPLSRDLCETLGLVGPTARASGLARDVRLDYPTGIYRFAHVPVSTYETGDVFARAYVRWLEMQRSAEFVEEQLGMLPSSPTLSPAKPLRPDAIALSLVEGWRGEICHVAITDEKGRFARYKVVDPSFHNWPGLAMALRGQQISDFPLCNKSFNLSYCGHDL